MGLPQLLTDARFELGARRPIGRTNPRRVRRVVARGIAAERGRRRDAASSERHLHHFERSAYSQNGEDGVITEILRRVGVAGRTFVEIGASDGSENCTRALLEDGWAGVWVEGDAAATGAARAIAARRPLQVVEAYVDRDNVAALLGRAGAADEPDVLAIDIDGNDWWIWSALSETMRPRLVVVEYNSGIGPRVNWKMPYDPAHVWDGGMRFGASLAAWTALARRLGYTLVGCESTGVNAFFVRDDLIRDRFDEAPLERHFVYGHGIFCIDPWLRPRPLASAPVATDGVLAVELDGIWSVCRDGPTTGWPLYVTAWISNRAGEMVGDPARAPLRLAWRWSSGPEEPRRALVTPWRLKPGSRTLLGCRLIAPATPGQHELELSLVQEGVRWFDPPGRLSQPVLVRVPHTAREPEVVV